MKPHMMTIVIAHDFNEVIISFTLSENETVLLLGY